MAVLWGARMPTRKETLPWCAVGLFCAPTPAKRALAPTLPVLVISHSSTSSSTCARGGRTARGPCRHGRRKHTHTRPSRRQQGVGRDTPWTVGCEVLLRGGGPERRAEGFTAPWLLPHSTTVTWACMPKTNTSAGQMHACPGVVTCPAAKCGVPPGHAQPPAKHQHAVPTCVGMLAPVTWQPSNRTVRTGLQVAWAGGGGGGCALTPLCPQCPSHGLGPQGCALGIPGGFTVAGDQ